MEKSKHTPAPAKKVYAKPVWEKQEIFERFTLACTAKGAKAGGGCTTLFT